MQRFRVAQDIAVTRHQPRFMALLRPIKRGMHNQGIHFVTLLMMTKRAINLRQRVIRSELLDQAIMR